MLYTIKFTSAGETGTRLIRASSDEHALVSFDAEWSRYGWSCPLPTSREVVCCGETCQGPVAAPVVQTSEEESFNPSALVATLALLGCLFLALVVCYALLDGEAKAGQTSASVLLKLQGELRKVLPVVPAQAEIAPESTLSQESDVKVAEYRHLIAALSDAFASLRSAATDKERKREAARVKSRTSELIHAACPRAKQTDRDEAEGLIDATASYLIRADLAGKPEKPTEPRPVFGNAGTLSSLLYRKGHCHTDHAKDFVMGWTVTINGIPTYCPERILEFGDVVSVAGKTYTL